MKSVWFNGYNVNNFIHNRCESSYLSKNIFRFSINRHIFERFSLCFKEQWYFKIIYYHVLMNNKVINKIHLIFETKVKIGYDGTSKKY
jgi:hypothetical protein